MAGKWTVSCRFCLVRDVCELLGRDSNLTDAWRLWAKGRCWSGTLKRAQRAAPLRRKERLVSAKEWSCLNAVRRAQHAAPLRREWSAGFLSGGDMVETGRRGDKGRFGEVGLTELRCCDCSPSCAASALSHIFIATMIGSRDADCKDSHAVCFSNHDAKSGGAPMALEGTNFRAGWRCFVNDFRDSGHLGRLLQALSYGVAVGRKMNIIGLVSVWNPAVVGARGDCRYSRQAGCRD
jgi:hypothetical protein